jgi:hypothetical protein
MPDPFENVNDLLEELEGAALHTSQGSFVKVDHVKAMILKRQKAAEEAKEKRLETGPPPKTFREARARALKDLEEAFPPKPHEPGRAVPAQPQSSSRT